jgi:hypothetical protein
LAKIITAWPTLSRITRTAILDIARADLETGEF